MVVVERNIVRLVSDTLRPLLMRMLLEGREIDRILTSKKVDSSKRYKSLSRLMRTQCCGLVVGWKVLSLRGSMSEFGADGEKEKRGGEWKEEEEYMPIPRPESCVEKASVEASVCVESTWCV